MKCWCSPGFHSGWPHFPLSAFLGWENTTGCLSSIHPTSLNYFLLAESTPLNWDNCLSASLAARIWAQVQAWIMGPEEWSFECSEKSFSPWQKREVTERLSLGLPAFKCGVKFNIGATRSLFWECISPILLLGHIYREHWRKRFSWGLSSSLSLFLVCGILPAQELNLE